MPATEYSRVDFHIDITVSDDRAATVAWSTHDGSVAGIQVVPPSVVAKWVSDLNLTDPLISLPSMVAALTEWKKGLPPMPPETLYRVTMDIADPELGGVAWESWLPQWIGTAPFALECVRTTRVRSRASGLPLTLPVRVVEIDTPPTTNVVDLFGARPPDEIALALQVERLPAADFPPALWPAVDILHCDPFAMTVPPHDLMSESTPEIAGTLAWFLRASDRQQIRLIVLHVSNAEQARGARSLATALVSRGGPAVLVADYPQGQALFAFQNLNRQLLHDFPLDFAFRYSLTDVMRRNLVPSPLPFFPSLFVGGGRENAVRVSTVARALLRVKASLSQAGMITEPLERREIGGKERAEETEDIEDIKDIEDIEYRAEQHAVDRYFRSVMKRRGVAAAMRQVLVNNLTLFENQWERIRFDLHESEGTLPVARTLDALRVTTGAASSGPVTLEQAVNLEVPAIPSRPVGRSFRIPRPRARVFQAEPRLVRRRGRAPRPDAPTERFLNATLWREDEHARLSRLTPDSCLDRGRVYQVGAQIGPRDAAILTVDATAIVEEVFKFTPDSTGVWVQIGVTGLDFDVLGHPVQELWLPRSGASEMVFFPIRTGRLGAARLRLVLYFKNFVVQSLRVGTVVVDPGDPKPLPRIRGERLAEALGSEKLRAPTSAGHAARLEYSLAVPVAELEDSTDRALTIVANDLDGQSVVTVRGTGVEYRTRTNNDLPIAVTLARDALHDVSFPPIEGNRPDRYIYQFGYGSEPNAGRPEMLKKSLLTLADTGWNLFTSTFPEASLPGLMALSASDQIVHVAHVLLEKSIPWAAMYDRLFDPNRTADDTGAPVLRDACLAALNADGTFSTRQCGTHPDCLLHAAKVAAARAAGEPVAREDTIACPLHFWGFRHIIEAPAQQPEDGKDTKPLVTTIDAGLGAQLVAGLNPELPFAGDHESDLDDVVKGVAAKWAKKTTKRDELLDSMKTLDPHLVYMYCHARDGDDVKALRPYLEFAGAGPMGRIFTTDLRGWPGPWRHAPLVILNGCGTAGFSPHSLSPFVTTLVQDRGAAGVLGTEISVAEMLAGEAALTFLRSFLAGSRAGAAMLAMRRALLAKANPLGLVYVLYSSADLRVIYSDAPDA